MCHAAFLQDREAVEALHDVVDQLLGRQPLNALGRYSVPFDVEQPNQHDSKKEFLLELSAVKKGMKHSKALLDLFVTSDAAPEIEAKRTRLRAKLDEHAAKSKKAERPDQSYSLILRNMAAIGFTHLALLANLELVFGFSNRLEELKDQELEFWSVSHRAPNYFARTIALRLARLYAREKGKRPTFGTSRDGGHPSTDFGRAVEQVFQILDIAADIRGPTEWAIPQLTEEDLVPPKTGLLGRLYGLNALSPPPPRDPKSAIVEALLKGQCSKFVSKAQLDDLTRIVTIGLRNASCA